MLGRNPSRSPHEVPDSQEAVYDTAIAIDGGVGTGWEIQVDRSRGVELPKVSAIAPFDVLRQRSSFTHEHFSCTTYNL